MSGGIRARTWFGEPGYYPGEDGRRVNVREVDVIPLLAKTHSRLGRLFGYGHIESCSLPD